MEIDYAQKLQKCHEYVEALEEEQKKIQVFQRELPLCLEIITKTIELCRKELSNMSEQAQDQSDCAEQTASVCVGPVFEEFIPMKKKTQQEEEEEEESFPQAVDTKKRSDWLKLWNQSDLVKKAKVIEVKSNRCGAFQPFQKEIKKRDFSEPAVVSSPSKTTSSTTEKGGDKNVSGKDGDEETIQLQPQTQTQSQTHRKQRRCWSPELHRRFLNALQQLGGSHVATPKQIRDYMKVDGLTNDEVKSHLQKYRLHTRRPTTSAAAAHSSINSQPPPPQFAVVAGGIWVHSPHHVAAQPPPPPQSPKGLVERSSSCCNLQATSMNRTTSSSPVS